MLEKMMQKTRNMNKSGTEKEKKREENPEKKTMRKKVEQKEVHPAWGGIERIVPNPPGEHTNQQDNPHSNKRKKTEEGNPGQDPNTPWAPSGPERI